MPHVKEAMLRTLLSEQHSLHYTPISTAVPVEIVLCMKAMSHSWLAGNSFDRAQFPESSRGFATPFRFA